MTELNDNVLNRRLGPESPKFKLWINAGLMLTYWCPARCECCYVNAGPHDAAQCHEMSAQFAVQCWEGILRLAGDHGQVHLTGGEPFGNYPRLKEILQAACAKKLTGLQKIETNAFWCTDRQVVRERLAELDALGLTTLQVSTDIYHQKDVPFERVRLAVEVGREVLGEDRVQVRWRDFFDHPIAQAGMAEPQRAAAIAAALQKRPERLLGQAAEKLITYFPSRNYNEFADMNCVRAILGARHIHIDGQGNIFAGTCVGIRLGNLHRGPAHALEELWKTWDYHQHPILSKLVEQGPVGLAEMARPLGFVPKSGYAQKCQLCYEVRQYLYRTGQFGRWLGPGVSYGLPETPESAEKR